MQGLGGTHYNFFFTKSIPECGKQCIKTLLITPGKENISDVPVLCWCCSWLSLLRMTWAKVYKSLLKTFWFSCSHLYTFTAVRKILYFRIIEVKMLWIPPNAVCLCCCCLLIKSCPILRDPMEQSTPGPPVFHCLPAVPLLFHNPSKMCNLVPLPRLPEVSLATCTRPHPKNKLQPPAFLAQRYLRSFLLMASVIAPNLLWGTTWLLSPAWIPLLHISCLY